MSFYIWCARYEQKKHTFVCREACRYSKKCQNYKDWKMLKFPGLFDRNLFADERRVRA